MSDATRLERIFEGLNPQQRDAVETVSGPLCILAGAGSGKTTTITRRLAHQVVSGAFAAPSLLAVTFTSKAATEMRNRLEILGVPGVRASTFHSAALSQVRYFGRPPSNVLPSKGVILGPLMRSLPKPYRFVPLVDVAAEIEWAKNQRIGPDRYLDALGDRKPPIEARLMQRIFARYEERKEREDAFDFEDMLELAIRLFDDREVVRSFTSRLRAFTVDEYQDVNLLQQTLLERWLDDRDEICAVGDDYQAIYSFTGASSRYLLDLPDRVQNTKVVLLETNYRSSPQILEVANRLVPRLGGSRKELRPIRPVADPPVIRGFGTSQAERDFIAREIVRLHEKGVAYEEIAILYRMNARSEDHEESLGRHGIPYEVRDDPFLQRAAARQIHARLRELDSTEVANQVRSAALSLGYIEDPAGDVGRQEYTRQKDLARFIRMADDFQDDRRTLRDFVAEVRARFGASNDRGGVALLTLHRSKGLEFEAVFIPKLEQHELPHRRADLVEERRLFYVGLTRAKRYLYVTWAGRAQSPFVNEVRPETRPSGPQGRSGYLSHADKQGEDSHASEELLEDLKQWRRDRARADKVPAFLIAYDSTLHEIARRKPSSHDELLMVKGIGDAKLERFGDDLLRIVSGRTNAE